ncbi:MULTISPECIES: PIN domain-containing protein [unclassified Rossellomorea]|uniref:type II toxin-antitoxin system VapC family toxin n=1 Tax=unclassified Rossellomorea TaxID=2837526 RepID=UPI00262A9084|nr:PIN domain-containing protein [uncultured Rossellomorea sp.]
MDTNYLIAFIDSSHPHHLSTVIHTIYLLQQKARLYISETVLSEAVDVLARGIYTEEQFHKWIKSEEHDHWLTQHTGSKNEYKDKKDEIRSTFITNIVKNHEKPELLRYYNKKSTERLEGLIQSRFFKLSNTTFACLETGMQFSKSVPLQSNDAFIAASAVNQSANLLTFDSDFKKVTIINPGSGRKVKIFTLMMTNNYLFNKRSHQLMNRLDQSLGKVIEQAVGGSEQFEKKFGHP